MTGGQHGIDEFKGGVMSPTQILMGAFSKSV
jgi:hypothetical protein